MTADRLTRRHSLLLGPMAEETRRSLGPLAWAALEALVTAASDSHDPCTAPTSVREFASRLGVSKNTAHRALVALRRAGMIEPLQARSSSGHFAAGAYRLDVDSSILTTVDASSFTSSNSAPKRQRSSRRRTPPTASSQLSLLPES